MTPKTNWVPTDYFNLTDWQRITSNFTEVAQELLDEGLVQQGDIATIPVYTSTLQFPYYNQINQWEQALQQLYDAAGFTFADPEFFSKTWYPRTSAQWELTGNPTYEDFNRWEILLDDLWDTVQYIRNTNTYQVMGTFTSNSNRYPRQAIRTRPS